MEDIYIERNSYIDAIEKFIDKPLIKVLLGMRRVGKSVLMKLMINEIIKKKGVNESNIIYINKESLEFDFIKNYNDLYKFVNVFFQNKKGKKYIFIDEIQEIEGWEKAVSSFLSDNTGDIIISGSNAHLLSSELATLISGRYIEIPVYPLTFKEFIDFRNNKNKTVMDSDAEFQNYLKYGGLPGIHFLSFEDEIIFAYLNSILNTVLFKDVISRFKIRDVSLLEKIINYLLDNVGNITSAKKIADYFKSQRIKISVDTVLNYIKYLEYGLLIKKVNRYDLKGKRIIEFFDKIFLTDIGLRNGLIGYKNKDINGILENIVYCELLSRGYKISVGVMNGIEIDFIAEKQKEKFYIQVCYSLGSNNIIEREFGNLEKIKDNYEKMVISLDRFFVEERNGIKHRYLIDFLLK